MIKDDFEKLKVGDNVHVIKWCNKYSPIRIDKNCLINEKGKNHIIYVCEGSIDLGIGSYESIFRNYDEALKIVIAMEKLRLQWIQEDFSKLKESYLNHEKELDEGI